MTETGRTIISLLSNLANRRTTGFELPAFSRVSDEGIMAVISTPSSFYLPRSFEDRLWLTYAP